MKSFSWFIAIVIALAITAHFYLLATEQRDAREKEHVHTMIYMIEKGMLKPSAAQDKMNGL